MRTRVAAAILFPPNPLVPRLYVAALDRRPGDAVGGLFLARVATMGFMGVIERLAVDVLCVLGQMVAHRRRKILVGSVGYRSLLSPAGRPSVCGDPASPLHKTSGSYAALTRTS